MFDFARFRQKCLCLCSSFYIVFLAKTSRVIRSWSWSWANVRAIVNSSKINFSQWLCELRIFIIHSSGATHILYLEFSPSWDLLAALLWLLPMLENVTQFIAILLLLHTILGLTMCFTTVVNQLWLVVCPKGPFGRCRIIIIARRSIDGFRLPLGCFM